MIWLSKMLPQFLYIVFEQKMDDFFTSQSLYLLAWTWSPAFDFKTFLNFNNVHDQSLTKTLVIKVAVNYTLEESRQNLAVYFLLFQRPEKLQFQVIFANQFWLSAEQKASKFFMIYWFSRGSRSEAESREREAKGRRRRRNNRENWSCALGKLAHWMYRNTTENERMENWTIKQTHKQHPDNFRGL